MRRLVANLDAEAELASSADPDGTYRPAPRPALQVAAAVGTLLRAFARDGDRLHLAAPLDAERLAEVSGLPRPRLESGPLEDLDPASAVLAWCETLSVARHRNEEEATRTVVDLDGPLHELLWRLPVPSTQVVARVHHRSFALEIGRESGHALPGADMLESLDALAAHLEAGGADASPAGRFVVKAPLSAAGRLRWIGSPADLSIPKNRRTLKNLFHRHGSLLFEPWMDRAGDFGLAALVGPAGAFRIVSIHRQTVDAEGRFTGLELSAGGLSIDERQQLETTAGHVARALAHEGYVGPFGLDAFRHRDAAGRLRFHPLGEVNTRMTVGLAARALADRLPDRGTGRLAVGLQAPDPEARTLLEPAGGPGLWWFP